METNWFELLINGSFQLVELSENCVKLDNKESEETKLSKTLQQSHDYNYRFPRDIISSTSRNIMPNNSFNIFFNNRKLFMFIIKILSLLYTFNENSIETRKRKSIESN